MTGGNLLVGHDHHHHQHFQQEQKLQEPDSVAVLKEQLQLFDNQEREKQLLELQTKMDEVYFFFLLFFKTVPLEMFLLHRCRPAGRRRLRRLR